MIDDTAPTIGLRVPNLRKLISIEGIIALAMALTVIAVAYREPLTRRTLHFGPESIGTAFYVYSYDDSNNGGASLATIEDRDRFEWSCKLKATFQWPYCGFGFLFDTGHNGKGLDLRGYDRIDLRLAYKGTGKLVRITLKDDDPRYKTLAKPLQKINQVAVPITNGVQTIPIALGDFAVADWWKEQTKAPAELARPTFRNIIAMEVVTGADDELGLQQFRIEGITFERHWATEGEWNGAIVLAWMLLVAILTFFRRRQFAQIRQSAEQNLRESERLYRGILEASTDAIVLLSPSGIVELVNGPGIAAMELDCVDRVLGKHWTRLWRDESAIVVAEALEDALAGRTARFRAFCATSKGTPKWWDVVAAPMFNDEGTITGLLTISRDITSEREKSEQLKWASEHDALTQLPNRRAFQARLQAAALRAMETGEQIGLLLIDLDHFKHINDALGHSAGDELLNSVAERLRNGVRDHDFVARIGGDEFAIILERVTSEDVLIGVGNQVVQLIQAPLRAGGRVVGGGASLGGALFPKNAVSANDLFKHADTALYALKQSGRGGVRLFDPYMLVDAEKTATQLRLARGAVTEKTVVPAYQPKYRLESGEVAGLEALLRWRHPRLGLQMPATLEEAFGDYELAAKIGELMQRKVARDMREWLESAVDFGRVAINAAPAEFLRDDYAERLLSVLIEHQVPPDRIEIEITEHAFFGRATEYVARALAVLKQSDITVSLDDFGTGYSSLSHLRDFPVDLVKIDMSFVRQMNENEEIAAIVAAVVSLARSLSIEVVAEGVETPTQLELLRAMGCHMAQGHLLSAPVEASAVPELIPVKKAAA